MRIWLTWWIVSIVLISMSPNLGRAEEGITIAPTKGMVTMLDIGKGKCIPCKMMAPILKRLKKEYDGKASIVFIDISKDHAPAVKYGIRAIPTQIFFDKEGKEIHRHVGFMSEDDIVRQLKKMGVNRPSKNKG